MAGSKSDFLENSVLDYWLGKSFTSTAPATVYIRLYNSTLNDASDAATNQCAGANYPASGFALTNSSANWRLSTGGTKVNKTTITFTTSASTGWGTVRAFAISRVSSTATGALLYWGDLTTQQVVAAGNVVQFSTGAIVVTES